jgi:hypothetical protein
VRLSGRFRAVLYLVVAVLFVTGAAWVVVDRIAWPETSTYLLRLHGGAAMAMLVLLGVLLPLHVRLGWRRKRNLPSGTVMLASNAILVGTAFGLYYTGSDTVRRWTSVLHIAIGFALPLVIASHVLLGWRSRQVRDRERVAAAVRAGRRALPPRTSP